jgi:hypothetical protein
MRRLLAASAIVVAMGCAPVDIGTNGSVAPPGPSDGGGAGGGAGAAPAAPAVVITSPLDGTTLAFDGQPNHDHFFLDVAVDLRNVRVAADCGNDTSCGALLLFIDDDRCGNPNASTSQGNRATVDFVRCGANRDGAHRLRADVWRGSTLVARSPEVHVEVRGPADDDGGNGDHDGGDDHGDGDDHGGDDHGGHGDDLH